MPSGMQGTMSEIYKLLLTAHDKIAERVILKAYDEEGEVST